MGMFVLLEHTSFTTSFKYSLCTLGMGYDISHVLGDVYVWFTCTNSYHKSLPKQRLREKVQPAKIIFQWLWDCNSLRFAGQTRFGFHEKVTNKIQYQNPKTKSLFALKIGAKFGFLPIFSGVFVVSFREGIPTKSWIYNDDVHPMRSTKVSKKKHLAAHVDRAIGLHDPLHMGNGSVAPKKLVDMCSWETRINNSQVILSHKKKALLSIPHINCVVFHPQQIPISTTRGARVFFHLTHLSLTALLSHATTRIHLGHNLANEGFL